jgi:lysine biosynthesis protein LysW
MGLEVVKCPVCKQKLALQDYVAVGALVVCANLNCGADLRVVSRRPARVEEVPESATYSVDFRPESYG